MESYTEENRLIIGLYSDAPTAAIFDGRLYTINYQEDKTYDFELNATRLETYQAELLQGINREEELKNLMVITPRDEKEELVKHYVFLMIKKMLAYEILNSGIFKKIICKHFPEKAKAWLDQEDEDELPF